MKKIIYGILSTVLMFAIIVGINYIAAAHKGIAFNPDWVMITVEAVAVGLICVFGPDAAQRKKNREKLAKRFSRHN